MDLPDPQAAHGHGSGRDGRLALVGQRAVRGYPDAADGIADERPALVVEAHPEAAHGHAEMDEVRVADTVPPSAPGVHPGEDHRHLIGARLYVPSHVVLELPVPDRGEQDGRESGGQRGDDRERDPQPQPEGAAAH